MGVRRKRKWVCRGLIVSAVLSCAGAKAQEDSGWAVTGFGGTMTDNVWEEALLLWKAEFIESHLLGVGFGYEWPLRHERWRLGFEAQAVGHFGRQDHFEFNLPVVVRYAPVKPFPSGLRSVAFGLGLSYATKIPRTETDRDGESRHTLIYWMGEVEFALGDMDTTLIARIHHRSDAYGLLSTDSGSNAIVLGLRKRF